MFSLPISMWRQNHCRPAAADSAEPPSTPYASGRLNNPRSKSRMLIALRTAAPPNPQSSLNISDLSRVHDAVAPLMLTHHLPWSW